MKKIIFVFSLFLSLTSLFANYTCSKGCDSQCKVGFLGNNVEPICYSGCKTWQLAKCYNISDPYVSTMGELGQNIYVAAAATMKARHPIFSALDENEKAILKPFYGTLVNRIRLHLKSNPMDRWGEPPYQIALGNTAGQTYGHDVYIRYFRTEIERVDRIILIGHELCHSRQYEQRGSSLHKFGRDYFEGFAKKGGYANNPMEKECEALEAKLQEAAEKYWAYYDQHKRKWDFEVCNKSDFESLYVALGWPHKLEGGFSLVPMRVSKGWYEVKKGNCKKVATNLASDEGIDAYATTGAKGNWTHWGSSSGPSYCVHPVNGFDTGAQYNCDPGFESVHFKGIDNPWRSLGVGTNTWNLTGKQTLVKICNNSGKALDAALLRGDKGHWRSEGWYGFTVGQCREWNFGVYEGSLFIYGENVGTGSTWSDPTQVGFCTYRGMAFEHEQANTCFTTQGGRLVKGYKTTLQHGSNAWNFTP